MVMETLDLHLSPAPRRRLQTLAAARSILANPDSSDPDRAASFDALLRSIGHPDRDPLYVRHAVKILGEAAILHRPLSASVFAAVRSILDGGGRLAADALAVLPSVEDQGSRLLGSVLDENLVLSLAASEFVSVRSQVLDLLASSLERDLSSTLLRPHLVLQVLLGFAADLYPLVRRGALHGLVPLLTKAGSSFDISLIECSYDRAVFLLDDDEEFVRSAAVRLVSECGEIFAEKERDNLERMDRIFIQLSSMARDMSMKVRVESFIALGKVRVVSDTILLQSLSKKIYGVKCKGKVLVECSTQKSRFTLSCAAGAFVHGIEDEFYEVRTAACRSLGKLTVFSIKFCDDALSLLMDTLNDDAEAVQLQTLQTLFHMAARDRLAMQEREMHMFLGMLDDVNPLIRTAARKVLHVMRIPEPEVFKSTIDGLIANMETYTEEEEEIFLALFLIGRSHKFATKLVKEFSEELKPSCDGEVNLDTPRVAVLLVLALSLSFSDKQAMYEIPASIFSYSIPLLGRISRSLRHIMNQDSLMAYLFHLSGMHVLESLKLKGAELPNIVQATSNSQFIFREEMEDMTKISVPPLKQSKPEVEALDEVIMQSIEHIMETASRTWGLVQSHCSLEARRTLRACKEELEMIAWNPNFSASALLAFTSEYVEVIHLVGEIWAQFKPKGVYAIGMVSLDLLLEKLDMSLRRMRYSFPGLCREEERHVLELVLLAFVFRQYTLFACSNSTLKNLNAVISRLEYLCEEGSSTLSVLSKELKRISTTEVRKNYCFHVRGLLELFNLEKMPLVGGFKHIKAELEAHGNDSENPLPFVSGLPVGIPFRISLHNVSSSESLWLRMTVGQLVQYVYLDLRQFEGSEAARKCALSVPFYATPRAASFLLKACVIMECPLEDAMGLKKGYGGPRHDIVLLCDEIVVYLAFMAGDM